MNAAFGNAVDIRRADDRVSVGAEAGVEVVGGNEQHIALGRRGSQHRQRREGCT